MLLRLAKHSSSSQTPAQCCAQVPLYKTYCHDGRKSSGGELDALLAVTEANTETITVSMHVQQVLHASQSTQKTVRWT